ncbi:hypothetical protein IFM89_014809 [Coptis chinensis]|uniref:Fanconi Anaemia group E protein C-terminal domain-containing protein n=1 Tax=Coptis chinensis TaxID=261450 RepID=A0A835IBA6_9MAGN|nr:hypothetical protein IFM89_014809 [Coptis chinensis]
MEAWVPLFNIFLNSPTPESEASFWFQHPFNSSTTTTNTSTCLFLSLLSKPIDVAIINSSSTPTSTSLPAHHSKSVMWIQTLPNAVQMRILSFLRVERRRFCKKELCSLANNILKENQELDFWVKKAACNLLDVVSDSSYDWVSGMSLEDCDVDQVEEEFESLPSWLKSLNNAPSSVLPWLPIICDELRASKLSSSFVDEKVDENSLMEVEGEGKEMEDKSSSVYIENVPIDDEVQRKATCLKTEVVSFESTSKTIGLADEIRRLCFPDGKGGGGYPFVVLGLIEPWEADDETASILLSHLTSGEGEDILWQCQVLCAVILPKMLVLSGPASRVLMSATIEFCKLHQKASVDALLFPLLLCKDGINNPICEVVTRIIRECLHPPHVSSFCQKLVSKEHERRRLVYIPRHQWLMTDELVWTESLFTLFQNILNHNVYLTQDTVDRLVSVVQQLDYEYSKSLKFGNFLLSLVTKCEAQLRSHKLLLTESIERTNTFMTKSILSKLCSL